MNENWTRKRISSLTFKTYVRMGKLNTCLAVKKYFVRKLACLKDTITISKVREARKTALDQRGGL